MVASNDDKKRYFLSLLNEIKIQSKKYRDFYAISSIYIGGGTPSCLDNFYIRDLLSCIYKNFAVKNSAEITIEINPNSVDKNKIREYILSGINRFSVGLQTTSAKVLKAMGRTHNVIDYQKTIDTIREFGVKNISTDLIVGYPGQKLADVKESLAYLLKLDIPHISAYMLQVEEGTKLKKLVEGGSIGIPKEDLVVNMYETICDTLKKSGYDRYELSNFAKPAFESYHNKIYWKRKDYLGLGLAAHSYIDGTRFANTENITEYVTKLENENEVPVKYSKGLTVDEMKEEAIMLSLRKGDGLDLDEYKKEFCENLLAKRKEQVSLLIKNGFLILTKDNKLKCTSKGFMVLNEIISQLI